MTYKIINGKIHENIPIQTNIYGKPLNKQEEAKLQRTIEKLRQQKNKEVTKKPWHTK